MFSALATHVNKQPCQGGMFVRCPCDFTQGTVYSVDLSLLLNLGGIEHLQTCFIDAADSADEVIVTLTGTGQRIICPAGAQGIFPIFVWGDSGQFSVACADAVLVTVFICNRPCIVPCVWPSRSSVPPDAILDSDNNPITDSDGNIIRGS